MQWILGEWFDRFLPASSQFPLLLIVGVDDKIEQKNISVIALTDDLMIGFERNFGTVEG